MDRMHLTREYLMGRVAILPTGCWQWTRAASREGYGALRINGKLSSARRTFWEMFVGGSRMGRSYLTGKNLRPA